ncbi:hypothetical protein J6590_079645 [Homalodisca vitripennis]|nr:hypothetical protein J6590_079645 [Homalodisca vitripennis]
MRGIEQHLQKWVVVPTSRTKLSIEMHSARGRSTSLLCSVLVQVRFIEALGIRLGYQYMETPIHTVEELFDIQPLFLRRAYPDLNFLRGLVNSDIDYPDLLGAVNFSVPRATRSKSVFSRRFQPTNYTQNYGISRLLKTGEVASSSVHFFGNSSFRTDVIGFLRDYK